MVDLPAYPLGSTKTLQFFDLRYRCIERPQIVVVRFRRHGPSSFVFINLPELAKNRRPNESAVLKSDGFRVRSETVSRKRIVPGPGKTIGMRSVGIQTHRVPSIAYASGKTAEESIQFGITRQFTGKKVLPGRCVCFIFRDRQHIDIYIIIQERASLPRAPKNISA